MERLRSDGKRSQINWHADGEGRCHAECQAWGIRFDREGCVLLDVLPWEVFAVPTPAFSECPFAVLREVLGVQEPTPKVEPFDRLEQCKGCRWSSIRKCAPPLNGGPCLDREVDNPPRPVRADLTLTALRLDALRLEGVLRKASNDICEILYAPTDEARNCSGDWGNCTCMRCKLMRLRDWILRRAKETMP
jgi:hypothetical protein